jgi:tryptophan-rich sensory protein
VHHAAPPSPLFRSLLALAGWVSLSFAASLPAFFWPPGGWYDALAKPSWTPPGHLFGPVWSTLYFAMGLSAWLVWRRGRRPAVRGALMLFLVQLALNALWTPVFFGLHQPGLGFAVLCLLWAAIAATILAFARHDALAGAMLVPYLGWVTFAAALNFATWRLA